MIRMQLVLLGLIFVSVCYANDNIESMFRELEQYAPGQTTRQLREHYNKTHDAKGVEATLRHLLSIYSKQSKQNKQIYQAAEKCASKELSTAMLDLLKNGEPLTSYATVNTFLQFCDREASVTAPLVTVIKQMTHKSQKKPDLAGAIQQTKSPYKQKVQQAHSILKIFNEHYTATKCDTSQLHSTEWELFNALTTSNDNQVTNLKFESIFISFSLQNYYEACSVNKGSEIKTTVSRLAAVIAPSLAKQYAFAVAKQSSEVGISKIFKLLDLQFKDSLADEDVKAALKSEAMKAAHGAKGAHSVYPNVNDVFPQVKRQLVLCGRSLGNDKQALELIKIVSQCIDRRYANKNLPSYKLYQYSLILQRSECSEHTVKNVKEILKQMGRDCHAQ